MGLRIQPALAQGMVPSDLNMTPVYPGPSIVRVSGVVGMESDARRAYSLGGNQGRSFGG